MTNKAKRTNINEELPKWVEIGCVGKASLITNTAKTCCHAMAVLFKTKKQRIS